MHLALRCLVALVLALAPSAARAEYWAMDMSELLGTAREILVVEVLPGGARAVVRESIRGRAAGEPVDLAIADTPPPAGTRMLVVCEGGVCPRAWGADRGGYYVLEAQEPGDGASVLPGLLDAASLPALASGRPAPELCVRASVRLLDEPRPLRVEARLSAGDGTGTARMGTDTMRARLLAPHGLGADERGSALLRLGGRGGGLVALPGQVSIAGGPLRRAADGCFELDAMPAQPFLRTEAQWRAALAGRRSDDVLARGRIVSTGAGPLARGEHPVEIRATADGQVELVSPVLAGRGVGYRSIEPGRRRLGVSIVRGTTYPLLEIEVADAADPPGLPELAVLAVRARRGALSLPIAVYGGRERAPVGRIELRYVPASP